jgi:hypothetical protein
MAWDAALALALYEEGEPQSLMCVGEPTTIEAFARLVRNTPPCGRRGPLQSTGQIEGLVEMLGIETRHPSHVLKWLVDNTSRALPWRELGLALMHARLPPQAAFFELAKAEEVVALLEYPEGVLDAVVLALLDAGHDERAAALIAMYGQGLRSWAEIAVSALLCAGDATLAAIGGRIWWDLDRILAETRRVLNSTGQFAGRARAVPRPVSTMPRAVVSRKSCCAAFRMRP